jgi:endonuclease-3
VQQTERDLKKLFPQESWNKLHLQIIYFGREHCSARGCDGTACELCRELFPEGRKAVKTKKA